MPHLLPSAAVQPLAPTTATAEALATLDGLRQAAGRLLGLEQERAQALLAAQAMEAAGPSSSTSGAVAESLERLEHGGLQQAKAQRQDCHAELARRKEDLARIKHKLAKVRQRLDKQLALHEAETSIAPASQTSAPHPPSAEGRTEPAPEAAPASAQTKEAKARLAELERQIGSLREQFVSKVRPSFEAAKSAAEKQRRAAKTLLTTTEGALPVVIQEAQADRLKLQEIFNLPDVPTPTPAGANPSFDQYLACFTELDDARVPRLRPHLLEGDHCGALLSALHKAAAGDTSLPFEPLWEILLSRNMQAVGLQRMVTNSLAQNDDLLKPAISSALGSLTAKLLHVLARGAPNAPPPARRRERGGQAGARAAFLPAATVLALLARHRGELEAGLLRRTTQVLSVIASNYQAQDEVAQALERQLGACEKDLGANIRQIQAMEGQRKAEQVGLQALQEVDRDATRTAAPAIAPANPAAITQTTTEPTGPDREAQILKLRGDLADLDPQCTAAMSRLDIAAEADQLATQQESQLQAAYEIAAAARGRAQDSARREREEARAQRTAQREQLDGLESQIKEARKALKRHPALAGLLEPADEQRQQPGALKRAIKKHVKPDNAALHRRARDETGYAGGYHSLGHMVEAVCDIYEDAVRHCPGLFAARSRAEFDAAAAALVTVDGKGPTNRECTHSRADPIARGYSDAVHHTERPTQVTKSRYSLCWHQGAGPDSGTGSGPQGGHVLISHLYPLVPHLRFQTLEP